MPMTAYYVYLPPVQKTKDEAQDFRLVADSKSVLALIFPLPWLLFNRLWLMFLIISILTVLTSLLVSSQTSGMNVGASAFAAICLSGLPGIYLFLEGKVLIANRFERAGWRLVNIVEANNKEEAEIRHVVALAESDAEAPLAPSLKTASTAPPALSSRPRLATGLFPE